MGNKANSMGWIAKQNPGTAGTLAQRELFFANLWVIVDEEVTNK